MTDPYAVLGVSASATKVEIAKAYRRLAAELHRDRFAGAPARERREADRQRALVVDAYRELRGLDEAPRRPAGGPKPGSKPRVVRVAKAGAAAAVHAPAVKVGRPAEPLPAPDLPYSKAQWDAALPRWRWTDGFFTYRCRHHVDVCATCGPTPDDVALAAGVVRPKGTWRRGLNTARWTCCDHKRSACAVCGSPPAMDPIEPMEPREVHSAPKKQGLFSTRARARMPKVKVG